MWAVLRTSLAMALLGAAGTLPLAAEGVGLRGVVRSSDGLPIPGARVLIAGTRHRALTDENGAYAFSGLKAGYRVTVLASLEGFADASESLVTGAVEVVNLTLEVAGRR